MCSVFFLCFFVSSVSHDGTFMEKQWLITNYSRWNQNLCGTAGKKLKLALKSSRSFVSHHQKLFKIDNLSMKKKLSNLWKARNFSNFHNGKIFFKLNYEKTRKSCETKSQSPKAKIKLLCFKKFAWLVEKYELWDKNILLTFLLDTLYMHWNVSDSKNTPVQTDPDSVYYLLMKEAETESIIMNKEYTK